MELGLGLNDQFQRAKIFVQTRTATTEGALLCTPTKN
jgi:hypothetical protein